MLPRRKNHVFSRPGLHVPTRNVTEHQRIVELLPIGIFHRVRRHAGMQFCPARLQSDAVPYYRRYWRLAFYVVCHRHRCLLSDRCPACSQPVAFHRHGIGRQRVGHGYSLAYCSACGADFRLTRVEDPGHISTGLQGLGLLSMASLQHSMALPCAVPFFKGLHCLVSILMGRHGSRLRREITDRTGLAIEGAKHEFELLSFTERARLMTAVYWLLEQWPTRFIQICSAAGLTRSRLSAYPSALPYWLASVAEQCLDRRILIPCDQEILAARDILLRHEKNITARGLAELMGISVTCARHARRVCGNSCSTLESNKYASAPLGY